MAEFVTVETGTTELADSIVLLYEQEFLLTNQEETLLDQFATMRYEINAKSISVPKLGKLAAATTALTETEDPDSVALADTQVTLTPLEYGNVTTVTELAQLQTGGKAYAMANIAQARNAANTQNVLAANVLKAATNTLTVDGGAEGSLTATDIMTVTFLNQIYNKLARGNVPKFAGDMYVSIMHDDQIHDLRNATAAGSWQDVSKYTSSDDVFKNEVGSVGGFRIIRSNDVSINTDAGSTTVDTYDAICMGAGALGKATSQEIQMVMNQNRDKLKRFTDFGWKGAFAYGILDQDNVYTGTSASSVGANT